MIGARAALGTVAGLRFNEWAAEPASGDDWFELYNADTNAVDLAGYYFTDNLTNQVTGLTVEKDPRTCQRRCSRAKERLDVVEGDRFAEDLGMVLHDRLSGRRQSR